MVMRRLPVLMLILLLTGCSALQGTPQPAPPLTDSPQEISRNQTAGLRRVGTVTALVRGAPSDAEEQIRAKATAAKADYYTIIMVDETVMAGQWYSQAILYQQSPSMRQTD
ncbi:biofilm peroxide resistance protein BsmA [Erwiniaceae bacterium CAU 1747]